MAVKNTHVSNMLRIDWIILPILLALSRPNTHGVTLPFFRDPGSVFGTLVCGGGGGFGQLLERNVNLKIVIKDID